MHSDKYKKEQEMLKKLRSLTLVPVINSYLVNCIDLSDYDEYASHKEVERKLLAVNAIYLQETAYTATTTAECLQWLLGLPSAINLDCMNYEIMDILHKWRVVPNYSEYVEHASIITAWWECMALRLVQMMRKASNGNFNKIRFKEDY